MTVLEGVRFTLEPDDEAYPALLRGIADPPHCLYGIGDAAVLNNPSIAVIGARKATPYGLSCVEHFTSIAARRGLTIVSGGAMGCDQAAHRTALENDARTVVVFGSGVDVVYPKRAGGLFQEVIDDGGAIISENPPTMQPLPGLFPRRNRIIAGLARLLLIGEAGLPSGTFSTADAALNAGREVSVVPGSITSPESRGANRLLCQGATPVVDEESFEHALDDAFALQPLSLMEHYETQTPSKKGGMSPQEAVENDPLLRALAAQKYFPEELTAYFDLTAGEVVKRLSEYELQGLVTRGYDGRYQCCVPV